MDNKYASAWYRTLGETRLASYPDYEFLGCKPNGAAVLCDSTLYGVRLPGFPPICRETEVRILPF